LFELSFLMPENTYALKMEMVALHHGLAILACIVSVIIAVDIARRLSNPSSASLILPH
jgi:hypothetical protein